MSERRGRAASVGARGDGVASRARRDDDASTRGCPRNSREARSGRHVAAHHPSVWES